MYRTEFLARDENKDCRQCGEPSTVVDHIVAPKGDSALFWDENNHRPLCKRCHDARVDEGDFGRTRSS